jgi:DNA invertase Pin-like site-specific DNA recombinase
LTQFGYVRVSREDQAWENQVQRLEREGVPTENIFVDRLSGIVDLVQRVGFSELEARLATVDAGVVYVFELSRIGRSFLETVTKIHDWEARGIRVVSLSPSESWSQLTDPHLRDLMLSIFSWVAAHERTCLIERTRLGLARARTEGIHLGRPPRQIPWSRVNDLQGKNLSLAAISRVLDIPYSTLIRAADSQPPPGVRKGSGGT